MRLLKLLALLLAVTSQGWALQAIAANMSEGEVSRHCLNLAQINHVEILDKQHIAFEMNNGDHYMNVLPKPCLSLHRDRALMYKTSLSKLCDLDIITVLDSMGGGYEPVGSCGLGDFNQSSEDEVKRLREMH